MESCGNNKVDISGKDKMETSGDEKMISYGDKIETSGDNETHLLKKIPKPLTRIQKS